MAAIAFPSIEAEIQDFGISYNTQVSSSDISGVTQTVELPGARWAGSLSYRDMIVVESATLKKFLLQLRGSSGRFFYGDRTHTDPFNVVTGSPTVTVVAGNRGLIRVTLGGGSPVFSPGDFIQIGIDDQRELKMVLASAIVSGDTHELTIEPLIRRNIYSGQNVVYTSPTGVFMLSASDQAKWASRTKAQLSDMSISFIEVFS